MKLLKHSGQGMMSFSELALASNPCILLVECVYVLGTVRILLRREQVYKLVCNHLVQPEMILRPMATSETAWCWFAIDFSEPSDERRFKFSSISPCYLHSPVSPRQTLDVVSGHSTNPKPQILCNMY